MFLPADKKVTAGKLNLVKATQFNAVFLKSCPPKKSYRRQFIYFYSCLESPLPV
jgi:hypothetical protein